MDRKIQEAIDLHLAKYHDLVRKRVSLDGRLANAESEKSSVKERIYKKVCREYKEQLDRLAEEIKPVENEVEKIRHMIATEMHRFEESEKRFEDKIEEFNFRHKVGEYGDDELAEHKSPVQDQLDELADRRENLQYALEQLDTPPEDLIPQKRASKAESKPEAKASAKSKAPAAEEKPTPAKSSAGKEATPVEEKLAKAEPKRDAKPAAEAPTAQADKKSATGDKGKAKGKPEDLVNPSEWAKEFQEEGKEKSRRSSDKPAVAATAEGHADALSDLADPSTDATSKTKTVKPAAQSSSSPAVATQEAPKSFPILVITQGPGAGKKLPLMPMTMTLGREHDNNIELKDEDVARYHARIAFERGQYLVQDLDSSSGTWVNDKRISETTPLKHGDKIRVGSTELVIDFS